MKKLAIISSAAALATMPLVGVFAESTTFGTHSDKVQVTIATSCSVTATDQGGNTNTISQSMTNGSNKAFKGTTMTVTCNDGGGWKIQAKGTGGTSGSGTAMVDAEETYRIMSVTNAGQAGTGSYWGMTMYAEEGNRNPGTDGDSFDPTLSFGASDSYKSKTVTTDEQLDSPTYEVGAPIPGTDTTVVSANGASSNLAITPIYNVNVDSHLPEGTYTGKVTYTLTHPVSED